MFYNKPPAVNDGDTAFAKDVNDVNNAADTAFALVEAAIVDLPVTVQAFADLAEKWAEEVEDVAVEPGKYSALHWAAKADDSALAAALSNLGASAQADTATTQASVASGHAATATTQAGIAATQAFTATTKATLASKYATELEGVEVEPGEYSAFHWSKKAQAYALNAVESVSGTGVDNSDPKNPVITITTTTIGIPNVDNTSDANKPISTATQSALDAKAPLASPTFTGVPAAPTAAPGTNTTQLATTAFVIANAPAQAPIKLFHMQDQRTQGSDGASSSVGINTRVLNTVLRNDITGASLLANQVTLPAGTYFIEARGTMGANVSGNKLRLYNVTDSTYILEGTVDNLAYVPSTLTGTITLADQKVLELRHYTVAALAGAFGTAISQGAEVYADLKIWSLP